MATLRCTEAGGWDGIVEALCQAMPGDEVVISAGEYRTDVPYPLTVRSGIHLRGEDNARLFFTGLSAIELVDSHGARISNLYIAPNDVFPPLGVSTDQNSLSIILVVRSNDTVIDHCVINGNGYIVSGILIAESSLRARISDCNISDFMRDGIRLLSSQCIANTNSCLRNLTGIAARRDKPHGPSELTANNNRCHNNIDGGISLFSSTGVLEGNECWGNAHGIAATHDSAAPSELTANNNRCHDNNVGILIESSMGVLESNDCWGNAQGIVAQCDPGYPCALPSKLTANNNHCHDNSRSGITLASSMGVLESNVCWGNVQGIFVRCSPEFPDAPSELTATNNRCHDNSGNGIALLSSMGVLESNECWENECGITALRFSDAHSKLTASNNRCHDNSTGGISLFSSTGMLEGNECWGNNYGIVATRGSDSLDAPSELIATNNRCHDNSANGIILLSSKGTLKDNECWNNKDGICIEPATDTPDIPSELIATHNRCHDNRGGGIALLSSMGTLNDNKAWNNEDVGIFLLSSKGELKDNECWNSKIGIYAQCDDNIPDNPSELFATNNRCHNNSLAGIFLSSSKGELKDNECWNNTLGISAQRNSDTSKVPSELFAINNRCYDNRSGIILVSSLGTLEDNKCRNNVVGIEAVFSELTATKNLLHNNRRNNIELPDSVGRLWGNETDGMPSGMRAGTACANGKSYRCYPAIWRRLRHENGKTCINLLPPPTPEIETGQDSPPPGDSLSSLIRTGGCPHCFHRFWLGDEGDAIPQLPTLESPAQSDDSSERIYEVKRVDANIQISRIPPEDICKELKASQIGGLARILECIDNPENQSEIYSVAWVSADTDDLDGKLGKPAEAIAAGPTFRDPARGRVIHDVDFFRRPDPMNEDVAENKGAAENKQNSTEKKELPIEFPWLDEQWQPRHNTPFREWFRTKAFYLEWPRAKAFLLMPAMELLLASLLVAAVSFGAFAFGLFGSYQGPLLPVSISETATLMILFFLTLVYGWGDLGVGWKILSGVVLAASLFAYSNRHRPPPLRFDPKKWEDMTNLTDYVLAFFAISLKPFMLLFSKPSDKSRLHWLKIRLFGYKFFGLIGFKPDTVIFVFREVNTLSEPEKKYLRKLASLRYENQRVLFITQMNGLGMLVNCWQDVWLDDSKENLAKVDRAYIIHNPISLDIKFDKCLKERELDDLSREIAPMLGYLPSDAGACIKSLTDDMWCFSDMLPMLVIGSNYCSPMHLSMPYRDNFAQIEQPLSTAILPYAKLLELRDSTFPNLRYDFSFTKARANKAEALLTLVDNINNSDLIYWRGRQAYRQKLGNALRDAFHKENDPEHERSKRYLAELMACGELFHAKEAIRCLEKWFKGAIESTERQRVALHCEAALLLMQERVSIAPPSPEYDPQVLYCAWSDLIRLIREPLTIDKNDEICASRISVVCLQAEAAINNSPAPVLRNSLEEYINNPFKPEQMGSKSIWNSFLFGFRKSLLQLSGMSGGDAKILLEKRFRQDWGGLPEEIKEKLRSRMDEGHYDALIFKEMSETADQSELEAFCKSLAHRPDFLVANLVVLAIPGALAEGVAQADIAATLQSIRNNVKDTPEMGARFIGIPCDIAAEVNQAAWHVLKVMSEKTWKWKSINKSDLANMANEIEGVALGTHGSVSRQLKESDVVPLEFKAGKPKDNESNARTLPA